MTSQRDTSKLYSPSWVLAMAIGSTIGWGSFVLPFDWIQQSGWAGAGIGFLLGGVAILVIAFNYSCVIEAIPVSGGSVAYALASAGRKHAAVAGSSLALGYGSIVALNASAIPLIYRTILPSDNFGVYLYTVAGWDVYLLDVFVSSLSLVVFALVAGRGAKTSGLFQTLAVYTMLLAVLTLFILSITKFESIQNAPSLPFPDGEKPLAAVAAIFAIAPWAFVGFDSIPQIAGELSFSPKKVRKLLVLGILCAASFYIAMIWIIAICTGDNFKRFEGSVWASAEAVSYSLGPMGKWLMILAVTAGVLTGLNGFYTASSRVVQTMSRARMLPAKFGEQDGRFHTPRNALFLIMSICLITPWLGRASLSWIVDMASVGITVSYFYTSLCATKIGFKGQVLGMAVPRGQDSWLVLSGGAGCVLSIAFLLLLVIPGAPGQLSRESFIALVVWAVVAAIIFLIRKDAIMNSPVNKLERDVFFSDTTVRA